MKKLFSLFLISAFVLISVNLFAQEKWSLGPEKMSMIGIGNPTSSPVAIPNYINPNSKSWTPQNNVGVMLINPNIRPYPSSTYYQSELYLTVNPVNPLQMFGGSNTYHVGGPAAYYTGFYITTNGGASWFCSDSILNNYGDPGPIFDKNGTCIMTYLGNPSGIGARYSTNFGVSWSSQFLVNGSSADKNLANSDDNPTSPYYGRGYVVWSYWTGTPYIVCVSTTNSGVSWGSLVTVNTPGSGHYSQGCDIVTGLNGDVYVTWAAPISGSPYTEDYYGFAKSTNGGTSFSYTENAFDGNGIRGTLATKNNLRVNSFPRITVDKSGGAYNGRVYIVVSQKSLAPAGSDADIVLHWSSNQGTSWSAGTRVNQDAMNNGKIQFFPAINVDSYGGINIVYYDDRNCLADSGEVYVSRSVDGGATFTDILVSDSKSKIKPLVEGGIATGYGGDYIGINSGNNKVWPFWMDWRSGVLNIWTTSIDLGPGITHTPLTTTEQTTGTRAVNCVITPAGSPLVTSLTKLFVAKNAGAFDSVQMTNSSGNNWTANITLTGPATYKYYIRTCDNMNRTAFAPGGAPANFYSFQAMPDTTKPVITHTPLGNTPKNQWPATVTASVTDNIGVDSVWVNWKKNFNGTSKRFKLNFTSGTAYTAAFNSLQSEVNYNDSIYYRIIAQDNSSNHNRDSTAQLKFKIISQTTACIGTGTLSDNFPFTTYWMDGRTDYLYTASEMIANGGAAGSIQKVGFTVLTADPTPLNGFKVKFQHTSLTTLTGFTSTGWTTCYDAVYTVPGTGLQYITLTTPFQWNGTSNLLMEICYNNSAYTQYSPVNATAAPGMFWEDIRIYLPVTDAQMKPGH